MSILVATTVIEIGLVCTIVIKCLRGFQILFCLFRDAKVVSDSRCDLLDGTRFWWWGSLFLRERPFEMRLQKPGFHPLRSTCFSLRHRTPIEKEG